MKIRYDTLLNVQVIDGIYARNYNITLMPRLIEVRTSALDLEYGNTRIMIIGWNVQYDLKWLQLELYASCVICKRGVVSSDVQNTCIGEKLFNDTPILKYHNW